MQLTLKYTLKLLCFQNKGFTGNAKDPFSGFNGPTGGGGGSSDFSGEDMFKDGEMLLEILIESCEFVLCIL